MSKDNESPYSMSIKWNGIAQQQGVDGASGSSHLPAAVKVCTGLIYRPEVLLTSASMRQVYLCVLAVSGIECCCMPVLFIWYGRARTLGWATCLVVVHRGAFRGLQRQSCCQQKQLVLL